MSITADILCILLDADRGMDDAILLAQAMERGDDARSIFDLQHELETLDASPEVMAIALCSLADTIIKRPAGWRRQKRQIVANDAGESSGPFQRWGYDGPITPRLPDRDWWQLRAKILRRDDHRCRYCTEQAPRMCVDHVVPLSRGGTNDEDNLVGCCVSCNSSKCDRLLDEWNGRATA